MGISIEKVSARVKFDGYLTDDYCCYCFTATTTPSSQDRVSIKSTSGICIVLCRRISRQPWKKPRHMKRRVSVTWWDSLTLRNWITHSKDLYVSLITAASMKQMEKMLTSRTSSTFHWGKFDWIFHCSRKPSKINLSEQIGSDFVGQIPLCHIQGRTLRRWRSVHRPTFDRHEPDAFRQHQWVSLCSQIGSFLMWKNVV